MKRTFTLRTAASEERHLALAYRLVHNSIDSSTIERLHRLRSCYRSSDDDDDDDDDDNDDDRLAEQQVAHLYLSP